MLFFNFLLTAVGTSCLALAAPSCNNTQCPENFEWPSQFVQSGPSTLRVLIQGSGPAVVLLPSYGRDGGEDYNQFSTALVNAGYLILRPQPRGTLGSTGPMTNVTLDDLTADVAAVIDTLAGGRAIVMGHAYGTFVAKVASINYPDKIPAIIVAAPGGISVPDNIGAVLPIVTNSSYPVAERLADLQLAFFTPDHDARTWLTGWYEATFAMEHAAVEAVGSPEAFWTGGQDTQILQIIPADDPFQPRDQWNQSDVLAPERTKTVVIEDASHALFPEQGQKVVDAVLPYLEEQTSRL